MNSAATKQTTEPNQYSTTRRKKDLIIPSHDEAASTMLPEITESTPTSSTTEHSTTTEYLETTDPATTTTKSSSTLESSSATSNSTSEPNLFRKGQTTTTSKYKCLSELYRRCRL